MADDRRRELRRRRILENSEARREKIFGVTKSSINNIPRGKPFFIISIYFCVNTVWFYFEI